MMKMKKMLIAGVFVLALSPVISTTVASTTVYAESQKQEEVLQEKNLDDGKKYELIQEDDGSIVVRVYENTGKSRANVASLPTYWGSWSTMVSFSNGFVAGAVNTGLTLGIGHVLSIFSVIPSGVLEALLEGASWTDLGSMPGNDVANFWDINNDGSVSFQKRTKADKWGNVELTEWRTI